MLNKTLEIYNRKKAGQWSAQKFNLGGSGAPFGRVWGRSWEGFGGSGVSWVVLGALFFMLVFRMVFKSGLGGLWVAFWFDFRGVGKDFGRVLGGGWERFWRIPSDFGLFWSILGYSGGLQRFWIILGGFWLVLPACLLACLLGCLLAWLLLAAAQLEFKFKISSRVCLFYLSLALLSSL